MTNSFIRLMRRLACVLTVSAICGALCTVGFSGASGASEAGAHAVAVGPPCTNTLASGTVIGVAATSDDAGYWIANDAGQVVACGDATNFGSLTKAPNHPIVGIAATPDGGGFYLVASDGGVFTFGDATFQGSTGAIVLNKPIVGMAVDPTTGGYWLVASDGGIFTFNAPFEGSTGAMSLNKPIVGMALDPTTGGYWLVASDGGIFTFNAPFWGSAGALRLNKPVVGMAPDLATGGYWLVASDGGIFSYNAPFFGSTGAIVLNKPIVGMESNSTGTGYRFVATDGGIFDFGSSQFYGSAVTGAPPSTAPTVVLNQSGTGPSAGIIGPLGFPTGTTTFTATLTYFNCSPPQDGILIDAGLLPFDYYLMGTSQAGGTVSRIYNVVNAPFGVQIEGVCSWTITITAQ